jgi:DNA-binding SARP family transcriptional activator/tetratricopeptide (TPR) repeat protein
MTAAGAIHPLVSRVTLVHAAAGWGKTTAVRGWLGNTDARWLRGADLGPDLPATPGVTVVDDLRLGPADELPPPPGDGARLVLVTRTALPVRPWPADISPAEVGPPRLALSAAAVARLLARRYAVHDAELAAWVHRATAGWPGLVHLLGTALAGTGATGGGSDERRLAALAAPGTAAFEYIRTEVIEYLSEPARRLLADGAHLESIRSELATALGHRRAGPTLAELARLGLLDPPGPGHTWYRVVPLVAAVAREGLPRARTRRPRVLATAAGWYRRHDRPSDALRLGLARGDLAGCADLLRGHGATLLAGGAAAAVVTAGTALPPESRDEGTDLLLAEALEMTGDTRAALDLYAGLAGADGPLTPAVAWRYGVAVYLWGDPRDALRVLRRGVLAGADTADEALLLGWTAAAYWLAGKARACRGYAERAHRAAQAAGDSRALANAHVALALYANLDGDPAAMHTHYRQALCLADAVGDPVLVTRIRANLAAYLEREGRYAEALDLLRPALTLASRTAHAGMLAMALCNQAMLLRRLGRLDEAATTFDESIQIYQRIGSRKVAYPLVGLADLHRERGRLREAESGYRLAVQAAKAEANRQGLVPALSGLALAIAAERPAAAADLARQALRYASGPQVTAAHLAAGWVALRSGRPVPARTHALAALDMAGRQRDRPGLAEALELRAAVSEDTAEARQALTEALAIWQDTAGTLASDRVRVALGALPDAAAPQRLAARLAADRLRLAGLRPPPPTGTGSGGPAAVDIRTLGGFSVSVGGAAVPATAWPSRKARDLLRILISRRGRPIPREELAGLLWGPDAGPGERVGHRLSVALSTVRGVLDPARCAAADHFVAAGQATIALHLDRVTLDVETFLATAHYGLSLARTASGDARGVLAAAERAFTGEVYTGEPYDEWARPLREEAHATYLHVLRELVTLARDGGELDTAVQYLLRILTIDPYDDPSHRDLVTVLTGAGRFGEAMRAHDRYTAAMRELGMTAVRVSGLPLPGPGPAGGPDALSRAGDSPL